MNRRVESEPAATAPREWRTFRVEVLGCKVNQYEAQQIERLLGLYGLRPAAPGETPDLAVIHTCAVTSAALRKSGQLLRRRLAEERAPCVIATGCGGEAGLLDRNLPLAAVVPPGPEWIGELAGVLDTLPLPARAGEAARSADGLTLERFGGHTRAFLKIQDGCDLHCSYCIVPSLRRAPRDKPLGVLREEARALAANGYRELVVTGVSVGLWGRGAGGLASVLEALAPLEGLERIRLSSLHPSELTNRLLQVWAASPKILPHIHLPLQAGSDAVLERMLRGYTGAGFLAAVARARAALDRPAFTTDVIVGFPGETDGDFERTLAVCRAAEFSRIHIFPYSVRPGTPAAELPGRVAPAAVQARVRALKETAAELAADFHGRFVGERAQVLCETWHPADGTWEGYTERYIPVRFAGGPDWGGRIVPVRLDSVAPLGMHGTAVEEGGGG